MNIYHCNERSNRPLLLWCRSACLILMFHYHFHTYVWMHVKSFHCFVRDRAEPKNASFSFYFSFRSFTSSENGNCQKSITQSVGMKFQSKWSSFDKDRRGYAYVENLMDIKKSYSFKLSHRLSTCAHGIWVNEKYTGRAQYVALL